MSLRHALNERPAPTLAICLALILGAAALLLVRSAHRAGIPAVPLAAMAFYSDDDGRTSFVDGAKKLTPFLHNGKEAVRAYVYRCGRITIVGYLQRHTEYGRRQNNALEMGSRPTFAAQPIYEVKRPGLDNGWVPADQANFARVLDVMNVSCPDASGVTPILIVPGQ